MEETILNQEAPIIKLMPHSDLDFLRSKREQYKRRLERDRELCTPYQDPLGPQLADTIYKLALLSVLLDSEGVEIDTYKWSIRLAKFGYIHEEFDNACGVIDDYIQTGGKNVR